MSTMDGKTCLVTGATSGIGAVTARELARLGAHVVIVGRNANKCERQIKRIRREVKDAQPEFILADLSSQEQIRRLTREFGSRYDCLDILVNNAGAYFGKRETTADGLEMTLALNHICPFALTRLLLDKLKSSRSARVVNVSSSAHEHARVNFEDLQSEVEYDRLRAYSQSKLANLLFTYELARRLKGTNVTVNALHPGSVATNLGSDSNWLRAKVRNVIKRQMLSPEEGAKTAIYLASSPDV
ncbi:MAG: SDR family oxidoreductase, partial [Bacteroidota bacterium]